MAPDILLTLFEDRHLNFLDEEPMGTEERRLMTMAVISEADQPTGQSRLGQNPPTSAPMIPTTILPSGPKPRPFAIKPASQPATAP